MSNQVGAWKNIGSFFGITKTHPEELRNKAERQIKEGEFGITLKRSGSKQNYETDKFVHGAQKVLSQIGAFQTLEESQEHLQVTDERKTGSSHSSRLFHQSEEPVAGTSKTAQDAGNQPLTLTTSKQTHSLSKQSVYNRLYTEVDDEETDVDTGIRTKCESKPKVTFEAVDSFTSQTTKSEGCVNEPLDNTEEIVKKQDGKEGEFGITLKRSGSKQNYETDKFVHGAQKVLSQIGAFQTLEESQEHLQVTDERKASSSHSSKLFYRSKEPVAGTSKTVADAGSQSLTLTTPKQTHSLSKQSVYNRLHTEDDHEETDIDTGIRTKCESKPKVTFEAVDSFTSQTTKSEGFVNKPLDNTEEIVKTQDGKVYSDPNVAYYQTSEEMRSSPEICIDPTIAAGNLSPDHMASKSNTGESDVDLVKEDEEEETVATGNELDEDNSDSVDPVKSEIKPEKEVKSKLCPDDVVYGKEALKHYKFYVQIERKVEKQRLKDEMVAKLKEYDWKLSAIDEMIAMAKDYYMNPNSENAARWKALKRNVKKSSSHQIGHTEHRRKLGSLPDYLPLFTYFMIFAQLVSFIVIYGLHGVTLIGVEPKLTVESGIQTFMGMETIHKWTAPNVWIGPSEKRLIGVGGVFAPCMRSDLQLQFEQSKQNYSTDTPLGCCEVSTRNVAGTTTQAECDNLTEGIGKWNADVTCNKRPVNKAGTRHNMKPCCLGLKGQCRLMSHKHCAFLGGEFYLFGPEHCSQVMCLENICHPGRVAASGLLPWQPDSPAQWWRVPLSLLYHHGIIQFLVVMVTQWFLLTQIEVTAGWFRMLIIYIISGTMALLTSSIMLPYQVHVGGMGAVCGMLGLVIVELFHFWKLVDRPRLQLLKLSVAIILLFLLGTLPYLDIFGMITGLISGALCGVIFLPYVTFGKWHRPVRVILIVSASGLLILICYFLLHLFVTVQSLENCEGCKKLNCLPYTEKMCDTSLWHQF